MDCKIGPTWVPVFPQTTSNNIAGGYREWYEVLGRWSLTDKSIGRVFLPELAHDIMQADGERVAFSEAGLLILRGAPITPPDYWAEDPKIRAYCIQHGYTRPEWTHPSATTTSTERDP
jgi:hypothetical protein